MRTFLLCAVAFVAVVWGAAMISFNHDDQVLASDADAVQKQLDSGQIADFRAFETHCGQPSEVRFNPAEHMVTMIYRNHAMVVSMLPNHAPKHATDPLGPMAILAHRMDSHGEPELIGSTAALRVLGCKPDIKPAPVPARKPDDPTPNVDEAAALIRACGSPLSDKWKDGSAYNGPGVIDREIIYPRIEFSFLQDGVDDWTMIGASPRHKDETISYSWASKQMPCLKGVRFWSKSYQNY